ncbi:glycosyltransferase, partial [bacterium]|nr:glycosyltransferase [bacterium]
MTVTPPLSPVMPCKLRKKSLITGYIPRHSSISSSITEINYCENLKTIVLKILFTIDTLGAGGKERRLVELLLALKSMADIEFELVVMSNDIHYGDLTDSGIIIRKIIRKRKKDVSVFRRFYVHIKKYGPDIVHCWDSMTAIYVALPCLLLGCKLVNGMVIDAPRKQRIFNKHFVRAKLTFPFSEVVVGNSRAGLEGYKVPVKKRALIRNGFNFKRISNLKNKDDVRRDLGVSTIFIVGMVAAYSKLKDYTTYFNAAQRVLDKRNDVTFIAVGADTDSREALQHIDKKHADNFRLLGKQSDVESLVNAMDIGILSTFSEGLSNAILEYMALGKPVIATCGGGTSEIVDNNNSGFLIHQSSPDEMAEKIDLLLNESGIRQG